MSWDVNIDNNSLKGVHGGTLLEHSLDGLLTWPSVKSVDTNDWAEESGIEVDLSELHFNARTAAFDIHFKTYGELSAFMEAIKANACQDWGFPFLGGAATRLRVTNAVTSYGNEFCVLGLSLVEDKFDCLGMGASDQPRSGSDTTCRVDNVPLSAYGVRLINDPYSGLLTPGAVKPHLIRTNKLMDGNDYAATLDGAAYPHVMGSHHFSIPCFMTGRPADVALNSFSLFRFLTRTDEGADLMARKQRHIVVDGHGADCYYQSMNITSLYLDQSKTWLTFNINFVKI